MANLDYSIFATLGGFSIVNTSSGGSIYAASSEGVLDRTGAGTNDDDFGIYRTAAVTSAIGHVIYIDVKLSAVILGSGSHGYLLLKDAAGIAKSSGGSFQVGCYMQGVNPTRFTTWDGAAAGGTPFNMSADTWYTVRFTVNGAGECQLDVKLASDTVYTNVGTVAGIDISGSPIYGVACQYRNNDEQMFVKNYFWTNDGVISPIDPYFLIPGFNASSTTWNWSSGLDSGSSTWVWRKRTPSVVVT